ncbi:MAG TPA: 50S ribosomal protein L15 [Candidatus Eisenbacteria bacterium]|nr:50S ribosomal protein L15 [Candidatus Eisenbacteria bacterium]
MTMRIGSIHPAPGSTRPSKRRGKGSATGLGGTAGKGHKGKKARAGGKIPAWFEGGQMPLQRRTPKRGFKNPGRVEYQVVQVGRLDGAPAGGTVDRAWLKDAGIVRRPGPIKLLAGGEIKHALTIKVDAASEGARKMIEAAGGKVELLVVKAAPEPAVKAKAAKPAKPAAPAPDAENKEN